MNILTFKEAIQNVVNIHITMYMYFVMYFLMFPIVPINEEQDDLD